MRTIIRSFTDHPASVNETYFEHMSVGGSCGWRMVLAGLACLVHAVLPFLFPSTGSRTAADLYRAMVTHRQGTDNIGVPENGKPAALLPHQSPRG